MKDKTSWFIKILDDAASGNFWTGGMRSVTGVECGRYSKVEHVLDLAVGRIVHGQLTLPAISVSPVDTLRSL